MAKRRGKPSGLKGKARSAKIYKCADVKAAIARELKTHITDSTLRRRLVDALGGEVAYGSGGGGGGVGVA
jgi:hypothetical protein